MNLNNKPVNFEGTIVDLVGDDEYTIRLRELGFIKGERVAIRGIVPFGGPLMVEIKGTVVALRQKEAECIQV